MNRVKSRLTVLLAIFAVLAMCLGIAFMPKADKAIAEVNTSTGFYVEDGAAARLVEGQSGIKWTVHITKANYNSIQETDGIIKGIGLMIRPTGVDTEGNEYAWTEYYYGGTLVFGEADDAEYVFPYAIYYDEIINDINKSLVESAKPTLTEEQEAEYLAKAYAMNLEVKPFVKVLPAEGNEYNVEGEADDTARSLQGVALAYLVGDMLAGEENQAEKEALLKSYLPGTYNEVAEEYKAEESFYSNYDAKGSIPIDSAIPMANAKIFYGAKEVTDLYKDGAVALSDVQVKVTEDGKVSDYLTILDTATGDVYKQQFVGVTLAIDEATDLDYFTIDASTYGLGQTLANNVYIDFGADDFKWDGYYVVLNDIDATGYTHAFRGGYTYNKTNSDGTVEPTTPSWSAFGVKNIINHNGGSSGKYLVGKGLSGTFDGRGHIISNLTMRDEGLFGWINGGTVKNIGFNEVIDTGNCTGVFGYAMTGGASINNVFINQTKTKNWGYQTGFIIDSFTNDCSISQIYIKYDNYYFGGSYDSWFVSGSYDLTGKPINDKSCVQDIYFVTKYDKPIHKGNSASGYTVVSKKDGTSVTKQFSKILSDAKYVDGVEQTGISNKFYQEYHYDIYTLDDYTITNSSGVVQEPYSYLIIEGAKRYTTVEKMSDDKANNDFSNFNPDVWEIINGIPTFRSTLTGGYNAYVNGEAIASQTIDTFEGSSFSVAVDYEGKSLYGKPVVTAVGGAEFVSITGSTVIANAKGVATINVAYAGYNWQFTLNTMSAPIALEQEYYYSAHDGQFYNDSFGVVALSDIFNKEILGVYDANSIKLTLADGLITGADFGRQHDWLETYFVFVTAEANYKLSIKAADAIINEASDLSIFSLKSPVTNGIFSPEGEGVFDGYYVMVNNIDATGYKHKFAGTTGFNGRTRTYATVVNDIKEGGAFYGKGFTGCFDGNGYTISNLSFDYADETAGYGGLFGIINGGIVENLALTAVNNKEPNISGVFAQFIVGDALISDIYLEIKGDRNDGQNYILADAIQETATFERMYLTITGSSSTALWGGNMFVKEAYAKNLTNVFKDCYMIAIASPVHSEVADANGWVVDASGTYKKNTGTRMHSIAADALYVDGVKNETATANRFFPAWFGNELYTTDLYQIGCNGKTYEIGSTYSIKIINGLKRYTSSTTFKNDMANNDFSNWTSDVWAVRDGYLPVFNSTLSGGLVPYINGADATKSNNVVGRGQSVQVIPYRSASLACINGAKLSIVSGSEFVKIEGDKIIGLAKGEAVVKFENGAASKTFTITVINPTIVYEKELQFSAQDGVIFDGANIVTVADILGEATNYTKITDKDGNVLTLDAETGAISGITTSTKNWEENALMFHYADKIIKVNLQVASLIIDEAPDFAYFTIKEAWDYKVSTTYDATFTAGDFYWDGLYVLAKNIDATGYTHAMDGGLGVTKDGKAQVSVMAHGADRIDYLGTGGGFKGKDASGSTVWIHGFVGTFDGQGYTISNLETNQNGLFGMIGGGAVIKNIGLINNNKKGAYPVLAGGIAGSSKVSNIFVSTPTASRTTYGNPPLFGDISSTIFRMDNVVIIDNTTHSFVSYTWGYEFGSFSKGSTRDKSTDAIGFGPSNSYEYDQTNVIIVSSIPMSAAVGVNATEPTVKMDAKYIDGVLNEATYTVQGINSTTFLESDPINGVRRYTSQETLTADVANISEQLNSLVASGYFNVENGVITWKNAPVA